MNTSESASVVAPAEPLERQQRRAERWSGISLAVLMLAALSLVVVQIYEVATGPLPPGPGTSAPAFTAARIDGPTLSLESLRGKIVLLDFWATWCPPCVASMPALQRVQDGYAEQGVVVLGVNQEPGAEAQVRRFLLGRKLTFDNVVDQGEIHLGYGVHSFPSSFLVDRDGVIRHAYRGMVSESRLRADIEALLE